jgi:hypothetical protein
MPGKTIFLSERGDDKNDGLSAESPVLTGWRAIRISIREHGTAFQLTGSSDYVRRMNDQLEAKRKKRESERRSGEW